MSIKVLSLLFLLFVSIDGLKILGILPFASKSHFNIASSIVKTLANAGHEVTFASAFPFKSPNKNVKEINVKKVFEVFENGKIEVNPFIFGQYPAIGTLVILAKMGAETTELFLEDPEVQKLIKSDEKFDVCIFEIFHADALYGIGEKFGCAIISYTTFGAVKWTDDMTGNISPTSYVPNPFYIYTDEMNFKDRFWNTAVGLFEHLVYHNYHLRMQRNIYKKYFPNAKRSFEEMYHNSSIIFTNTHVSTSTVRPNLPQIVEIAGIHLEPSKALPNDIQEFLDSATDGAIYFSMGSFIQSKMWPVEKREALVRAFGKLKQKVLWKYENETLPGNPGNIKIGSWFPQRDILAHPNVKLFITHGGLLGGTEANVAGKPLLGFPIFGDQMMNMVKVSKRGYGLQINFNDINEENVSEALKKILNDPSYTETAKEISRRFLDRPLTPQQSVVYWTEYVARHKGAPHLKAAAAKLNFIELYSIDVCILMALIFVVILIVDYYILKFLLKLCFKKKSQKVKKN